MKVFISWSDKTSQRVAEALGDWLPYVLQAIEPFISSGDIDKGERWGDELNNQLAQTSYGIICLTRHNIHAAWMNFEAGALSKAIPRSRVSPFLFHVESDRVTGPLQQFQHTYYGSDGTSNQNDVLKLVLSLNDALAEAQRVPPERLKTEFHKWWDDLEKSLRIIWEDAEVESIAAFKWLFLREDIVAMQCHVNCEAIWVIASHPYLDTEVKDVMQKKMEGGCIYTYILADSPQNEPFIKDFEKIFEKYYDKKAILRKICSPDFESIAAVDYIIINPENSPSRPRQMFFELPTELDRMYWTKVDERTADNFYDRFLRYARPN
jgi:TIR domain